MSSSFLDRESTIAPPGYNRFLFPPAALAVHLCIGQAYAFSTFNLPLTKLLHITQSAPSDWKLTDVGWTFSIAIVLLGRSAKVHVRLRPVLRQRVHRLGGRYPFSSNLAPLPGLRRPWRVRIGHRLYLAGVDADQMVSGPPRHGDGNGHHGLRRRRVDCGAVVDPADGALQVAE